jgi:hypothetical protein
MTASGYRFVSFTAIALCFCLQAHGRGGYQQLKCEGLLPLPGSQSGYQKRDNRCEGLYVTPVGVESVAAISFTLGALRFESSSRVRLEISASEHLGPINVRSVAIPPKTYYRMDASVAPGAVLVWPVGDVLLPEHLGDNRIGVFGWKGTENDKTLVPVSVTTQGARPAGEWLKQPLLTFKASFDAQQFKWRWAATREDRCLPLGTWQSVIEHPVTASWPVTINLSQLPAGLNCVEVAAQSGNSNAWNTLDLRVEIPPR